MEGLNVSRAEHYEFSAAFRGDTYNWHPDPMPGFDLLTPLLICCLHHKAREVVLESCEGETWSIEWSQGSRHHVRGGSLQIEADSGLSTSSGLPTEHLRLERAVLQLCETRARRPWVLERSIWDALCEDDGALVELLRTVDLPRPRFGVRTADQRLLALFGQLELGPHVAIIIEEPKPGSPLVELFMSWRRARGWLFERIGPSPRDATPEHALDPDHRERTLAMLTGLERLSHAKVSGWNEVEQAFELVEQAARLWTTQSPNWEVIFETQLHAPTLDVVHGKVHIPLRGAAPRARQLARRLGALAIYETELGRAKVPVPGSWSPRTWASLVGFAFALGLLMGIRIARWL